MAFALDLHEFLIDEYFLPAGEWDPILLLGTIVQIQSESQLLLSLLHIQHNSHIHQAMKVCVILIELSVIIVLVGH